MPDYQNIIKQLNLSIHPEGGYYRRVYQSATQAAFDGSHRQSACTAILYLLHGTQFSAFHRIESDELWFLGEHSSAVRLIELNDDLTETIISAENPFYCVKAGTWFAAQLLQAHAADNSDNYALLYCTVSPGFEFSRFELACAAQLAAQYPRYQQQIHALCKAG